MGDGPQGTGQPASARPGPRLGRPPDPRLSPQFVGQDVRGPRLRGRPRDASPGLRRHRAAGDRGQAADPAGRVQRLFAEHQLRADARDRRPRGRGVDGRHGPLRGPGGRQGAPGRVQPDRLCARGDDDDAQDPAWSSRRAGPDDARVLGRRRPRVPAGARGPPAPRHGRQGGRLHRGAPARVRHIRPEDRRQRRARWPRPSCAKV